MSFSATYFSDEMKIKKSLSILLWVICAIGFGYHLYEISFKYFGFTTTTKTFVNLKHKLMTPSIVLCIRYMDIFDKEGGRKIGLVPKESNKNEEENEELMNRLTVKQIFSLTPDSKQVINSCKFREDDHGLKKYNSTQCTQDVFKVSKYHAGRYICYQFMAKVTGSGFDCNNFSFSLIFAGSMYSITLSHDFMKANLIRLMTFMPSDITNTVPAASKRFFSSILRYPNGFKEPSTKRFLATSGDMYHIKLKPPPFDTMCTKDKVSNREACLRRCNFNIFGNFNMTPPSEFTSDPDLELRHFGHLDYENQTLVSLIQNQTNACSLSCVRDMCEDTISVTRVDPRPYLYENGSFTLASMCAKSPAVFIIFEPSMTLVDFFIYVSSCLGIWFGVSIRSLAFLTDVVMRTQRENKFRVNPMTNDLNVNDALQFKPHSSPSYTLNLHNNRYR